MYLGGTIILQNQDHKTNPRVAITAQLKLRGEMYHGPGIDQALQPDNKPLHGRLHRNKD
jgi:hypothetical protein